MAAPLRSNSASHGTWSRMGVGSREPGSPALAAGAARAAFGLNAPNDRYSFRSAGVSSLNDDPAQPDASASMPRAPRRHSIMLPVSPLSPLGAGNSASGHLREMLLASHSAHGGGASPRGGLASSVASLRSASFGPNTSRPHSQSGMRPHTAGSLMRADSQSGMSVGSLSFRSRRSSFSSIGEFRRPLRPPRPSQEKCFLYSGLLN